LAGSVLSSEPNELAGDRLRASRALGVGGVTPEGFAYYE
jgi:hypothetical protein